MLLQVQSKRSPRAVAAMLLRLTKRNPVIAVVWWVATLSTYIIAARATWLDDDATLILRLRILTTVDVVGALLWPLTWIFWAVVGVPT
jgi:hypothetical protein